MFYGRAAGPQVYTQLLSELVPYGNVQMQIYRVYILALV